MLEYLILSYYWCGDPVSATLKTVMAACTRSAPSGRSAAVSEPEAFRPIGTVTVRRMT